MNEISDTVIKSAEDDPVKLKVLVEDLTRRLQNALHTIDSQKQTILKLTLNSESIRNQYETVCRQLTLEIGKNAIFRKKKIHEDEIKQFDKTKKLVEKLQQEFRMALLDHEISGNPRESVRVQRLREQMSSLENKQNIQKMTLIQLGKLEEVTENLCIAAQNGDAAACEDLIVKRGADIHFMDSIGFLPLHYAVAQGHVGIIRLFMNHGADPTTYLSGVSSMEVAGRYGQVECIFELMRYGVSVDDTGEFKAAEKLGFVKKTMLSHSAHNYDTALLSAVRHGHVECARELIEIGADFNRRDQLGDNIFHLAASLSKDFVPLTTKKDVYHEPVVTVGKKDQHLNMIKMLLNWGDKIRGLLYERNKKGLNPMQLAIELKNSACVRLLNSFFSASTVEPSHMKPGRNIVVDIGKDDVEDEDVGGSVPGGQYNQDVLAVMTGIDTRVVPKFDDI